MRSAGSRPNLRILKQRLIDENLNIARVTDRWYTANGKSRGLANELGVSFENAVRDQKREGGLADPVVATRDH